jgi:hypothetical protein
MPRKQYLFYRSSEEKVVGKRRNTERHKKTKEYEKLKKRRRQKRERQKLYTER